MNIEKDFKRKKELFVVHTKPSQAKRPFQLKNGTPMDAVP